MKVAIDESLCSGCGLCADICPEVFELGDEVARVINANPGADLEDKVREAESSCPSGAISLS